MRQAALASAALVGLASAALYLRLRPTEVHSASGVESTLRRFGRVPTTTLAAGPWPTDWQAAARSADAPLKFSNVPALAGLTRWRDPAHLTTLDDNRQRQMWQAETPEFVLARGEEAAFARSRSVSHVNASVEQFWAAAGGGGSLLYHSANIDSFSDAVQAEAAPALQAFGLDDVPLDHPAERWPRPSLNVWLSHAGVLATAHYDPSHNFCLQLVGRKTWLLWPPEELDKLRLHPSTHPSRRQTRLPLLDVGSSGEAAEWQ